MEIHSGHHAKIWTFSMLSLFQKVEDQKGEKTLTITP